MATASATMQPVMEARHRGRNILRLEVFISGRFRQQACDMGSLKELAANNADPAYRIRAQAPSLTVSGRLA